MKKILCRALLLDDRLLNKEAEGMFNSQFIVLLIIKWPTHRSTAFVFYDVVLIKHHLLLCLHTQDTIPGASDSPVIAIGGSYGGKR